MIFKEFGNKNKPVMIFFHGGGLSWWSLKPQIEALKNDYFIVTPIIDGHGDDWNNTFISIEKSAEGVIQYIKNNYKGKVFSICGLSIGAQIVVEILSREGDITEYAVIESALVYPMKMATKLTVPMYNLCYGLIKKRWYAKLQAKTLNVPEELFEAYYMDSSRMTKESLINITKSNGGYSLPSTLGNTKAKTLILVGEKELSVMKKSAILLHHTIKGSYLKIIEKSGHGEISLIHTDSYIDLLRGFFENNIN
ncbi:pimeloyl-ACP methyl ester carboxylesterase [Clostridium punense]|uniref:Pimeloyl-ACP methyl ester carboxylesterase n=1 Tax=Clostridium punense TaxID=1054297 RepID=A0ABS4K543_9CLOT|nr:MULTISPECIES: alpha/beta hydrolase [Clostridium]EQB86116.1 alpha/beta hydrolase [Clostridium sp. BL8]MBP2022900.1 pimeloyl-ACP methyl ester carboxylesterase [Clostridium punense]